MKAARAVRLTVDMQHC